VYVEAGPAALTGADLRATMARLRSETLADVEALLLAASRRG
jgi:hypothetical protein